MRWIRCIALYTGILLLVLLGLAGLYYYKGFGRKEGHAASGVNDMQNAEFSRLRREARSQKLFLSRHGLSADLLFLADMRISSGKNRFFVYDLHKDSVLFAGLVAHGCGNKAFSLNPSFSNTDGSSCTSLGRYRIGYPYPGHFGRSYKLYGLDSSNSRAFDRSVVLHPFDRVPDNETFPYPICNSHGCAMVSPGFLKVLQPLIDQSRKPVCLDIFY